MISCRRCVCKFPEGCFSSCSQTSLQALPHNVPSISNPLASVCQLLATWGANILDKAELSWNGCQSQSVRGWFRAEMGECPSPQPQLLWPWRHPSPGLSAPGSSPFLRGSLPAPSLCPARSLPPRSCRHCHHTNDLLFLQRKVTTKIYTSSTYPHFIFSSRNFHCKNGWNINGHKGPQ